MALVSKRLTRHFLRSKQRADDDDDDIASCIVIIGTGWLRLLVPWTEKRGCRALVSLDGAWKRGLLMLRLVPPPFSLHRLDTSPSTANPAVNLYSLLGGTCTCDWYDYWLMTPNSSTDYKGHPVSVAWRVAESSAFQRTPLEYLPENTAFITVLGVTSCRLGPLLGDTERR